MDSVLERFIVHLFRIINPANHCSELFFHNLCNISMIFSCKRHGKRSFHSNGKKKEVLYLSAVFDDCINFLWDIA